MPTVRRFRLRRDVGPHYHLKEDGTEVEVKPGTIIETTSDLCVRFPNKFDDLDTPEDESGEPEVLHDETLSDNVSGVKAKVETKVEETEEVAEEAEDEEEEEKTTKRRRR